jgi:ornithine decarboxylase
MVMATALVDHLTPADHFNDYVFIKDTQKTFLETNTAYHGTNGEHHHKMLSQQLIGNALRDRVENIDHERCEAGDEDTFFVADLGEVYRQHLRWKLNLPRVKPFYGKRSPL